MKKILFAVLSLVIAFNSFGQEPAEQIKLVIIDYSGNVITPDIWVRSKNIDQDNLKVIESKQEHLIIDSLPKFQFGSVNFDKQSYTIGPMVGSHWLDIEYTVKLSFEHKVMKINLITNGRSFSDTIKFEAGNFIYLHYGLNDGKFIDLPKVRFEELQIINKSKLSLSKKNAKIIHLDPNNENDFCSLNCNGIIKDLDSDLERILLMANKYFPRFLIVNNFPAGVLIWNKERLYVCYFSDDFIAILKENY